MPNVIRISKICCAFKKKEKERLNQPSIIPLMAYILFRLFQMPNATMSRGRPCNYYKGFCNSLGDCEDINMDGPLRLLYYTFFTEEGMYIAFSSSKFIQ